MASYLHKRRNFIDNDCYHIAANNTQFLFSTYLRKRASNHVSFPSTKAVPLSVADDESASRAVSTSFSSSSEERFPHRARR